VVHLRRWHDHLCKTAASAHAPIDGPGTVEVEVDAACQALRAGESVDVPLMAWHRLANPGPDTVALIEVQCGSYFGEDDIERRADDYGRAGC
jgi:mannose-1-phosphate guanylyltransferase